MDSEITVLEVQNDYSIKEHRVALKFPRVSKRHLFIVTNQNTQLHLLNKEGRNQQRSLFQHGVSTKVLIVTDATGTAWEVRMLLSPSEISRLAPNFNMMGFVKSCLMMKDYQDSLSSLCGPHPKHEGEVQELSRAAATFLSTSEDQIVSDYCEKLSGFLTGKLQAFCSGRKLGDMVMEALVALVAAELAASVGAIGSLDYRAEKKTQEDQQEQIKIMMNMFDVMVDLLTVTHQGKRVQIIFRNPCPDNWALGGKKPVHSEETFVFGLCHKVVAISEAEFEVQFLQNLQESYDLVSVFHLPAFVENVLMTSAWRNKMELFLKNQDGRKEIIHELSSLALKFICSKTCQQKTFMREFQREMLGKWSKDQTFFVGDEVICSFGILVAILAAVTAKSIVDRPVLDSDEEHPIASSAPSPAASSNISLDETSNSCEVVVTKISDECIEAKPDLDNCPIDLAEAELESGKVAICDAKSKFDSTNDPGMTDQGITNGSSKNNDPVAESPGVGTLDIAHQESGNDDDDNKEDPEKSAAKLVDPIASSAPTFGSSGTLLDKSSNSCEVVVTAITDGCGGAKPDLDNCLVDLAKVELESGKVAICGANSKINSTNDPGMTDQGNIDGSLKNDPVAESPGVGTLDIADQESGNDDDVNKEDPEKSAAKLVDPIASSVPSFAESSDTLLDNSLNSFEVIGKSDEYGELKPVLESSSVDWVKIELESGEVTTYDTTLKIASVHDPEITTQGSIDGSLKTGEPSTEPSGVGTVVVADQEADNGDDVDENFHKHIEATDYENGSISPEERAVPTQGISGGPSLDGSSNDGTYRVAQPPSEEARNNVLETQDSPFRNSIFKTSLMGLVCLLLVAMLTMVLPPSVIAALVAIILGLLVVKWLASQQP